MLEQGLSRGVQRIEEIDHLLMDVDEMETVIEINGSLHHILIEKIDNLDDRYKFKITINFGDDKFLSGRKIFLVDMDGVVEESFEIDKSNFDTPDHIPLKISNLFLDDVLFFFDPNNRV